MKKEQMTLLVGVIGCAVLSWVMFLLGIDIYNISWVAIGVLLATVLIMKSITRQTSENTFLMSGVMVTSFLFVFILFGLAVVLPSASFYMVLVYGIAIVIYIILFYFARHIKSSHASVEKNITELQQCLELIHTINSFTKDKQILEKFQIIEDNLKQLDLSRDYDLMRITYQFMQYIKDNRTSQGSQSNIEDIEMLVAQYVSLSKQAKYGKAI